MQLLITVLLICAAVCFFLYAFTIPRTPWGRVNMLGLGLFLWILTYVIPRLAVFVLASLLLCSCSHARPPVRVAPSVAGVTSSVDRSRGAVLLATNASHRTSGHVRTARTHAQRIEAKAQVLLDN